MESMRQWVLPVATTTAGSTSRHRAAGRAAAHGEHRGSRYCLSSLRQQVVHHGIAPAPGGRQRVESMRQWVLPVVTVLPVIATTAGRTSLHRTAGRGGSAWKALRQRVLPVITVLPVIATTAGRTSRHRAAGRAAARGEHEAVGTACRHGTARHRYDSRSCIEASRRRVGGSAWRASRQRVLPVITWTAGRASSSLRRRLIHHGIAPPGGRQHMQSIKAVDAACHPSRYVSRSYTQASRCQAGDSARPALRQWVLPVINTTAGRASS